MSNEHLSTWTFGNNTQTGTRAECKIAYENYLKQTFINAGGSELEYEHEKLLKLLKNYKTPDLQKSNRVEKLLDLIRLKGTK